VKFVTKIYRRYTCTYISSVKYDVLKSTNKDMAKIRNFEVTGDKV